MNFFWLRKMRDRTSHRGRESAEDTLDAPSPVHAPMSDSDVAELIRSVRAERLTYCGAPKMENLARAAQDVISRGVKGDFLEAGVALGGSAIVLGRIKEADRDLNLYDVFEMIPAPGARDGDDAHCRFREIESGGSKGLGPDLYYGYTKDLIRVVRENLTRFGVPPERSRIHLKPGLFEQSLDVCRPVALAHIDCDWYDSVKVCVNRILPYLSVGGVIAFDDYSSFSSCRTLVDELLDSRSDLKIIYKARSIGLMRT